MYMLKWVFLLTYLLEIKCFLNETPDILNVVFSTLDNLEENIRRAKDVNGIGRYQKLNDFSKDDYLVDDLSPSDFYMLSSQEDAGVFLLDGFTEKLIIHSKYMKDLIMFKHIIGGKTKWYAVVLESIPSNMITRLVIYRIEGDSYNKIVETIVHNDEILYTYSTETSTYIILVWNKKNETEFQPSKIFMFDDNEKLHYVQKINVKYATDVVIWKDMNEVFLAVAQESDGTSIDRLTIYKWLGKHFDQIQTIDEVKSQKVISFKIGHIQYLAVANYKDDSGNTEVYSQIFNYDIHNGRFIYHQRILTHGAVDIKHFCFKQKHIRETFLVVANSHDLDLKGNKIYRTESIIYKFVNDYFIPFQSIEINGIVQWLPVVGGNGEFVLIALSADGIQTFQYDGWKFIEVNHHNIFKSNITTMRAYLYQDEPLIVVVYDDSINYIKPVFKKHDFIRHKKDMLYSWSIDIENQLSQIDVNDMTNKYKEKTNKNNDQIERAPSHDDIKLARFRMDELENILKLPIVIDGDLTLDSLIVTNNDTTLHELNTNSVNSIDITGMYEEILDLTTNFTLDDFVFDDVEFENTIIPTTVNERNIDQIDLSNYGSFIVDGNVYVKEVNVGGMIDSIKVDKQSVLLRSEDQDFNGFIKTSKLDIDEFDTEYLNQRKIFSQQKFLNNISSIDANNIIIKNINKINFPAIQKLVLQNLENQQIASKYRFEKLICKNFHSDGPVSNVIVPQNLIVTDSNTSYIQQDVIFEQPIVIKKMKVTERLNHIPVHRKQLDILLKNTTLKQYISGVLSIENLTLLGLVKLQGKISNGLDGIDPFVVVDKDLTVVGDYKISGKVFVENGLVVGDVRSHGLSLGLVRTNGLRLDSSLIQNQLKFTSEVYAENLKTNLLNGINYDSFILLGAENELITGVKNVENAWFNGLVHVFSVNGNDLLSLFNKCLQKSTDQTIESHHHYTSVIVNRIDAKLNVENVKSDSFDHSGNYTIVNPCVLKSLKADNLKLVGRLNEIDFNQMLADTVFDNEKNGFTFETVNVTSEKHFKKDVIVDKFIVNYANEINMGDMQIGMEKWMNSISIEDMDVVKNEVKVGKLFSKYLFNGTHYEQFGTEWLLYRGEQTVESRQHFGVLNTKSTFATNDFVLYNLYHSMVRNDEDYFIENGIFSDTIICFNPVRYKTSENFDINSLVLTHNVVNNRLLHHTTILKNLTISGSFVSTGLVSGLDLQTVCDTLTSKTTRNIIHITGTATISSASNIQYINDHPLKEIVKNTWYIHDDIRLPGYLHLSEMFLEDKLIVQGHVDDTNLQWLSKNYFSKSKDEIVISKLSVKNITFEKDLYVTQLFNVKYINDIDFDQFILMSIQHEIQTVPVPLRFGRIISNVQTASPVNNMYLNEFMRYDVQKNVCNSKKVILSLNINHLLCSNMLRIQNVDVNHWLDNAVLINETSYISATKNFKKVSVQTNIDCRERLNSFLVSEMHAMSRRDDQIVTGIKTFINDLFFDSLKIDALNNVDFDLLLLEQINKYGDNTIYSPIVFESLLTVNNVDCRGTCQDKRIETLLQQLNNIENLNGFKDQYAILLGKLQELLRTKQFSAYYLDFYKNIQSISKDITGVLQLSEKNQMLVSSKNTISSYGWDDRIGGFVQYNDSCVVETTVSKVNTESNSKLVSVTYRFEPNRCMYNMKLNCYDLGYSNRSMKSFYLDGLDQCCLLVNDHNFINISCVDSKEETDYKIINKGAVHVLQVNVVMVHSVPYLVVLNKGYDQEQTHVNIFKYDYNIKNFVFLQVFYISYGKVIDSVCVNNFCFIAIATTFPNLNEDGFIKILQYDSNDDIFVSIQEMWVDTIEKIFFSKLPTNEILLYAQKTESNIDVYRYEGISGFGLMADNLGSNLFEYDQITTDNQHFIIGYNDYFLNIIQAFYKRG